MAIKKTAKKTTAAKSTSKKPSTAASKTTVTRVISDTKESSLSKATSGSKSFKIDSKLPKNLINIIIAEIFGTFTLTLVALSATSILAPLYVGLTLASLVLIIGIVSGTHLNPAVTFGLWTMRKLKTSLVPFYWIAQFLGSMAAVVLLGVLSGNTFVINFDQFSNFSWGVFTIELVGMAIFMFGIAAAVSREDLKSGAKAMAIGISLAVGLLASGTLLSLVQNTAVMNFQEQQAKTAPQPKKEGERNYPKEVYVNGATLNPAVALAVTEKTESQLQSNAPSAQKNEKTYTRLSLEVILSTLIGAALGGNLFLIVNYRSKAE